MKGDLPPKIDLALSGPFSSFLDFLASFLDLGLLLAATGFSGAITEPKASKLSNSKVSKLALPTGPEGSLWGILEAILEALGDLEAEYAAGRAAGREEG